MTHKKKDLSIICYNKKLHSPNDIMYIEVY